MNPELLFTQALGLTSPWAVDDIDFDPKAQRIDFRVSCEAKQLPCPGCGRSDQPIHDRKPRTWRHLDFFQFAAYVHAEVPRVRCGGCKKTTQVEVPWARPGSRFTLLFEAFALTLAKAMPVSTTARQLRTDDRALWRVLDHHVTQAQAREDYSTVTTIGVDETACRRGHHYITLVHDLAERRLIFATPGRDAQTLKGFSEDLASHQGKADQIRHASIDMSKAYISGLGQHLPNAEITFDRFHIIQLANQAVDAVRKSEVRHDARLKRTKWAWLTDMARWSKKQDEAVYDLTRSNLKTARAWRIKEALRDIFQAKPGREQAEGLLKRWHSWARRCRLEPMKRLAATIKQHWAGVLQGFESGLSNGYVEAMNSLIQAAKARARGYGTASHFIAICFLIAGKLKHLPANPFQTPLQRMVAS